ncbi:MAG: MotA/TolQ/ExbB proton channel family protein [Phycisphaerales bacterium]
MAQLWSGSSVDLIAQAAPSGAGIASVWDFAVKGGILMIPIAICSLIAIALGAERLISLRRERVIPSRFLSDIRAALSAAPPDLARARALCESRPSPMARICEAALARWSRPVEEVEKHVAEMGQREAMGLRKYVRGLSVIASVSPLLGLLGTIFGMIRAFQTVATSGEALGKTEMLAGGIYEAMITTAAGLIVAIPTLILYHFIGSRVERLVLEMDAACISLVEERTLRNELEASRATSASAVRVAESVTSNGAMPVSAA